MALKAGLCFVRVFFIDCSFCYGAGYCFHLNYWSKNGVHFKVGLGIYRLEAWRERAMAGLELGLKDRHGEPEAEALDTARRHIGELSMENELLRERARTAERRLPLAMRRSRR